MFFITAMFLMTGNVFGFPGGDGSAGDPWQIATKDDLEVINDMSAHYILNNDIDLTGETYECAAIACYKVFTGSFDGNGFAVIGLKIEGSSNVGLFGAIGGEAEVRNLDVVDCNVSGGQAVGGLAGGSFGSISNCSVTGTVTSSGMFVGGLTGGNYNGGSITNSYASVTVTGSNLYIGGLVGSNSDEGSSITGSYATGDVTVTGSFRYIGGLAGYNREASVADSYATGNVTANDSVYVGGLVGESLRASVTGSYATGSVTGTGTGTIGGLMGSNSAEGSITNCYSTGTVTSDAYSKGGLVGYGPSGTITNSYFLDTAGPDNEYGEPLTDAEMKQQASFVDWDFTTPVWKILTEGADYPCLAWQPEYTAADINGDGEINREDVIVSLQVITNLSSSEIVKEADIDGDGKIGLQEALFILRTPGE